MAWLCIGVRRGTYCNAMLSLGRINNALLRVLEERRLPKPDGSKLFGRHLSKRKQDDDDADFRSPVPIWAGKSTNQSPVECGTEILKNVLTAIQEDDDARSVARFWLNEQHFLCASAHSQHLTRRVRELAHAESGGRVRRGNLKRCIVDYVSPNLCKELHVGHLRSILLGDVISRVMEDTHEEVERVSHVGDFGQPIAVTVAKFLEEGGGRKELREHGPPRLSELYQEGSQKVKKSKEFKSFVGGVLRVIQGLQNDMRVLEAWNDVCDVARHGVREALSQLNVRGPKEVGESFYGVHCIDVIQEMLDRKLAFTEDDAVVVAFDEDKVTPLMSTERRRKAADEKWRKLDRWVVEKQHGTFLYSTTDLACLRYRSGVRKADTVLYLTDASQAVHFERVMRVAEAMGWAERPNTAAVRKVEDGQQGESKGDVPVVDVRHVTFGHITLEGGKKLRSRSGNSSSLTQFLQSARDYVREVAWRNTEERPKEVGDRLATACIKFHELYHSRSSSYSFSFERMTNLKGKTALYLAYAHSRQRGLEETMASVFGDTDPAVSEEDLVAAAPQTEQARQLALLLTQYPDKIAEMEATLMPSVLCSYMYALCQAFNGFYETEAIVAESEPAKSVARMNLVRATNRVLCDGFYLLGIEPDRV